MTHFICATCGMQHAASEEPPARCVVCEDARQYVPESGQAWTTLEELRSRHASDVRQDGEYRGVGMDPSFAIGQRALLVPFEGRQVMWDCIPLVDDAGVASVAEGGGLAAIAISHPHYYSCMVEWAHRFDCPVLLHADDARWVLRPDPAVELWEGETRDLGDGLTLIRGGGHFAGGTMLHDARAGTLLCGDIVQVIPDRSWVGFMYSYPNLIPLPADAVRAIAAALEPFPFERIYGAWWDRIVRADGSGVVARSAERYVRALDGELPAEPPA
jgi:glyoxylase-like metal-dependent hydrolase (beta-lactamase superfamily II)